MKKRSEMLHFYSSSIQSYNSHYSSGSLLKLTHCLENFSPRRQFAVERGRQIWKMELKTRHLEFFPLVGRSFFQKWPHASCYLRRISRKRKGIKRFVITILTIMPTETIFTGRSLQNEFMAAMCYCNINTCWVTCRSWSSVLTVNREWQMCFSCQWSSVMFLPNLI